MGTIIQSPNPKDKILFHTATGMPITRQHVSYRNGCELCRTIYQPHKELSATTMFFKGLKNILSKLVR